MGLGEEVTHLLCRPWVVANVDLVRTLPREGVHSASRGTVDLNLGPRADPVTGYVAMSRFKRADDVLILQPFELAVFQQGVSEEANLLLEHLRGNDITRAVQEKEERDNVNEGS